MIFRKEPCTRTEQHRDDSNMESVNQIDFQKLIHNFCATANPDVFPFFAFQSFHKLFRLFTRKMDVILVFQRTMGKNISVKPRVNPFIRRKLRYDLIV